MNRFGLKNRRGNDSEYSLQTPSKNCRYLKKEKCRAQITPFLHLLQYADIQRIAKTNATSGLLRTPTAMLLRHKSWPFTTQPACFHSPIHVHLKAQSHASRGGKGRCGRPKAMLRGLKRGVVEGPKGWKRNERADEHTVSRAVCTAAQDRF